MIFYPIFRNFFGMFFVLNGGGNDFIRMEMTSLEEKWGHERDVSRLFPMLGTGCSHHLAKKNWKKNYIFGKKFLVLGKKYFLFLKKYIKKIIF